MRAFIPLEGPPPRMKAAAASASNTMGSWPPLTPVGKFKFQIWPSGAKALLTSPKRAPATG